MELNTLSTQRNETLSDVITTEESKRKTRDSGKKVDTKLQDRAMAFMKEYDDAISDYRRKRMIAQGQVLDSFEKVQIGEKHNAEWDIKSHQYTPKIKEMEKLIKESENLGLIKKFLFWQRRQKIIGVKN